MGVPPNNKTLLIPNKAKTSSSGTVTQKDYGTDMRTIEQWAKGVGGLYASLTGPGETTSPGSLTQSGPFSVVNPPASGGGITFVDESGVGIGLEAIGSGVVLILATGTAGISLDQLGSGGIAITDHGNGGININGSGTAGVQVQTDNTGVLSFFGVSPVTKPTVTGSRGGNAALASLLTALATLGLVIDSSTP